MLKIEIRHINLEQFLQNLRLLAKYVLELFLHALHHSFAFRNKYIFA